MSTRARIAFIGIGNMGTPMAANLVAAGHDVRLHDARPGHAAAQAAAMGCSHADSPAQLAEGREIVITMLPDDAAVRRAMLDEASGLASHLAPGTILLDMSSSAPEATRTLGAELALRGIVMIDAPVSGLVPRAREGTLTIMVGCDDPNALETVRPVLEVLGERIIPVGGLGCGHAMKALNNIVAATCFAITAEALMTGKAFGLDPARMIEVIDSSSGRNFHTATSFPNEVLTGREASGFTAALLAKDAGIAAELARSLELPAPLATASARQWRAAADALGAGADNTAAARFWASAGGVDLAP